MEAQVILNQGCTNNVCVSNSLQIEHNYQPLGDGYHQFEHVPNIDHLKFRTLLCTKCGQTIRVVQENEKA